MPMFIQGLGGMNRRLYDGGMQYAHNAGAAEVERRDRRARRGALGLFQIPFIINFFSSIKVGQAGRTTTRGRRRRSSGRRRRRRGHGNFLTEPVVYRGPYEYSVPGAAKDFTPQFEPERPRIMEIPYTVEARPDTGLTNGKLGIWLFLASEVMLFGALFSTYILLRVGAPEWPHGELSVPLGTINTVILISSSVTMVMAWASLKMNNWGKHRLYLRPDVPAVGRLPRQQVLRVRASTSRRARGRGTARSSRSTSR